MTSIDTVNDLPPRIQYVAAAAQTIFPYPFPVFNDSDLVVYVDGVLQALNTDYTVDGEGDDLGGDVTFMTPMTGAEIVTIYRDIDIGRDTDISQNGPWSSAAYNNEQDKIFLLLQQLKSQLARCLRVPIIAEVEDDDIELQVANFANMYLTFDADGKPTPAVLSATTLTQAILGQLLYPRSAAEIAATVTPTNYYRIHGEVVRYDAVGDNSTDNSPAFQAALNQAAQSGGAPVTIPTPALAYRCNSALTYTANRPLSIRGSGWGYSAAGVFSGGCWINFVSSVANAALFDFTAKIEGFEASNFSVKLSTDSKNQRAFRFAEVLQGYLDSIRFEGTSTAFDTNTAVEFLNPVSIGGVYTGNFNLTRCSTTGIQRAVRIAATCTTVRINNCEFYGNNPSSASLIGVSVATGAVGVNITNSTFQGWATTAIDDDGTSTLNAHNYYENNGITADHTGATFPMIGPNRIISGGAVQTPSDRTKATIHIQPRTFMVDDTYAQFGLGYRERYRAFGQGEFPTYTPSFPVVAPMTFTAVATSTVQGSTTLLRYNVYGFDTVIDFMFQGTVGGTPGTELRFSLPTAFNSPTGRVRVPCKVFNAGAFTTGYAEIRNGEAFVRISLDAGGSFTAGTAGADGRIGYYANN